MKIYNKKKFLFGTFLLALGVINGGLAFWQQRFDWSAGVLVVAMLIMGGHSVLRSVNQEATREDQLEASDERNQYITMKSHHKTLQYSRLALFLLALAFTLGGAVMENDIFLTISGTFGVSWLLTYFVDMASFLYYHRKMTEDT